MRTFNTSIIRPVFANTKEVKNFAEWLGANYTCNPEDLSWDEYSKINAEYAVYKKGKHVSE